MTPTAKLTRAELFFFEHASYSFDLKKQTPSQGRTECAQQRAAAEALFHDVEAVANWSFRIGPDNEATDEEGEARFAMWIDDTSGRCRASLHGIDDDGATYGRVVRAELALGIVDDMREALAAEAANR